MGQSPNKIGLKEEVVPSKRNTYETFSVENT